MQKENMQVKFANIAQDSKGNFIVNGDNNILCTSKDGLKFISKNSLLLDANAMICPVEDELYQIELDNLNDKANNASNIDTTDESSTSATTNESAIIKKNHDTDSSFSWNDEPTRYFLSLYQENRKLVLSRKLKTLKAMWIHIANTMTKSGYNVSPLQVENKFKTMERAYKNMVSNNKKTGRGRATCSYMIF
ncbi:uncharacterized protein LOC114941852 [Nylanderia fulva]|uniref:uncharacterized protein LOC114941852 n=1 Tax=Nylanderia fulva TaxID=613905 RepID=UPI0010FBB809|nr:uncharacterized protein LOC114941852 [Nylanderia fulva]